MDDPFESDAVGLLERHIESASIVYREFPSSCGGLSSGSGAISMRCCGSNSPISQTGYAIFDKTRVSEKADVIFIKPVRDRGSRLCCAISTGQGTPDARETGLLYLGVQWIGTGTAPWEDPRIQPSARTQRRRAWKMREKWQLGAHKFVDVELHAPATLKRIAGGDRSTEKFIADQAVEQLRKLEPKILEASAAGR